MNMKQCLPALIGLSLFANMAYVPRAEAQAQTQTKGKRQKYEMKTIAVLETGDSIIDAQFYQMLKDMGRFNYISVPAKGIGAGGLSNIVEKTKHTLKVNKGALYDQMRATEEKFNKEFGSNKARSTSSKLMATQDTRLASEIDRIPNLAFMIQPEFVLLRPHSISDIKVETRENRVSASLTALIPVLAKINVLYLDPNKKNAQLVRSLTYRQDVSLNLSPRFDKSNSQLYLGYLQNLRGQLVQGNVDFLYPNASIQKKLLTLKSPTLMGDEIKKALIAGRDPKITQAWRNYLKSIQVNKPLKDEEFVTDYLPMNLSGGLTKALFDGYDLTDPDIAPILIAAAKEATQLPVIGGLLGGNLTAQEALLLYKAKRNVDLKGGKSAPGVFLDSLNATDLWSIGMFRWMMRDIQSIEQFKLAAEIEKVYEDKPQISIRMGMEYGVDRDTWFKTVQFNEQSKEEEAVGYYKIRNVAFKSSIAQGIMQFEEPEKGLAVVEVPTIAYNLTAGNFLPFHFNDPQFKPGVGAYVQGAFDLSRTFDRMAGRKLGDGLSDFINELYTTQTLGYTFGEAGNYPYQAQLQLGLLKKHYIGSLMPYYGLTLGGNIRSNRQKKERDEADNTLSHYHLGLEAGLGWMFWYDPFIFVTVGASAGLNIASEDEFSTYFDLTPKVKLGWEF
jgi:hypothetical protein